MHTETRRSLSRRENRFDYGVWGLRGLRRTQFTGSRFASMWCQFSAYGYA